MDSRLIFLHFCTVVWRSQRGNQLGLWNVLMGALSRAPQVNPGSCRKTTANAINPQTFGRGEAGGPYWLEKLRYVNCTESVPQTNTGGQLCKYSKMNGRTLAKELGNTVVVPSVEGLPKVG